MRGDTRNRADTARYSAIPGRLAVPVGVLLAASAGVLLAAQLQSPTESTSPPAGFFADRPLPPEPREAAVQLSSPQSASSTIARHELQPVPEPPAPAAPGGPSTPLADRTDRFAVGISARAAPALTLPEQAATETASVSVLHLHRLGHCQGRMIVARDALTFVPDEKAGRDAFAFEYGEFQHSVDGSMLIIRSQSRTYRFRETTNVEQTGTVPTLADVGAMISSFQRGQVLH